LHVLYGLCTSAGTSILHKNVYGKHVKKAIRALVFAIVVAYCAKNALAGSSSLSGSTTGLGDDTVSRALAEEFAKCSAFYDIAAECVKKTAPEKHEKAAAQYVDLAKRFYRGSYRLAGQDFTRRRIQFHDTAMRRSAGYGCEAFPKLEQQYRKHCDDTFKRLPRSLQ